MTLLDFCVRLCVVCALAAFAAGLVLYCCGVCLAALGSVLLSGFLGAVGFVGMESRRSAP